MIRDLSLLVKPCNYRAAVYAVTNWHYSHRMPSGKMVRHGVWERGTFIGVLTYSRGANRSLGAPYRLGVTEACELTRVALTDHTAPVSQILARSLALLRTANPGLRLVISYADPHAGHHGGIYQAGNWIYDGLSSATGSRPVILHGVPQHKRTISARYGTARLAWLRAHVDPNARPADEIPAKHRYLMPLDKFTRRRLAALAQPYPHAVEASEVTRNLSEVERQVQSLSAAPVTAASSSR